MVRPLRVELRLRLRRHGQKRRGVAEGGHWHRLSMAVNRLERRGMLNKRWCLSFLGMSMAMSALGAGEDLPVFRLDCNNGVFTPKQLLVPAGKKFKIEIYNTGT